MIRIKNSHTFLKHVCTTISVEDIGLGISEADLPLIFSPYFKTTDPNSMNVN
jgi:signal transduction histidine kinase